MEHAIIPAEILVLIALTRAGAYNGLMRSCKRLQQILISHSEECMKRWIRRYTRNEKFARYVHHEMKVYANICPNGAFHGEYKIVDPERNKILEVHNYKFGVLHGNWYKVDNYNYRTSAQFEDGLLHGLCKFTGGGYRIDLVRTYYVKGVRCGSHEGQYISGGKMFSINYVNGMIEGEAKYYYPDTSRICCREYYRRGKLHGMRTMYTYEGIISRQDKWEHDVMIRVDVTTPGWRKNPRLNMGLHLDDYIIS